MSTPVEPIVMLQVTIWCRDPEERYYEKKAPTLPTSVNWHTGMRVDELDERLEVEYVLVTDEKVIVMLEDINWDERFSWKDLEDGSYDSIFTPEKNGWTQL